MSRRRRCPLCGNNIRLRNDGTFYRHVMSSQNMMIIIPVNSSNQCAASQLSHKNACKIRDDRAS